MPYHPSAQGVSPIYIPQTQPSLPIASTTEFHTLDVLCTDSTILDSFILDNESDDGGETQTWYIVHTLTEPELGPERTIVWQYSQPSARPVGFIEWPDSASPVVEMPGIVGKGSAASWLRLSKDRRYRSMYLRGRDLRWVPNGKYIQLYGAGPAISSPQLYGYLVGNKDGGARIGVAAEAMQTVPGLVEVFIVASVLFMSGRDIDADPR